MVSAGISKIAYPKLVNPAQSLHLSTIDQVDQPSVAFPVKGNTIVEGIAKNFVGHAVSDQSLGAISSRANVKARWLLLVSLDFFLKSQALVIALSQSRFWP